MIKVTFHPFNNKIKVCADLNKCMYRIMNHESWIFLQKVSHLVGSVAISIGHVISVFDTCNYRICVIDRYKTERICAHSVFMRSNSFLLAFVHHYYHGYYECGVWIVDGN